jgi:hypothetical protein
MTILRKSFVRVHARYTGSPHAEDLTGFALWLTEHDYSVDYAQRLVFHTMRYARADMDLKRQVLSQVFPETLAAPAAGRIRLDGSEISGWLRRL